MPGVIIFLAPFLTSSNIPTCQGLRHICTRLEIFPIVSENLLSDQQFIVAVSTAIFFLCLVFGSAGILQVYLGRLLDIGSSTAHMSMMFWFKIALFFGVIFLTGALATVFHLFTLRPAEEYGSNCCPYY